MIIEECDASFCLLIHQTIIRLSLRFLQSSLILSAMAFELGLQANIMMTWAYIFVCTQLFGRFLRLMHEIGFITVDTCNLTLIAHYRYLRGSTLCLLCRSDSSLTIFAVSCLAYSSKECANPSVISFPHTRRSSSMVKLSRARWKIRL